MATADRTSEPIGRAARFETLLLAMLLALTVAGCRKHVDIDMTVLASRIVSATAYDINGYESHDPEKMADAFQAPMDIVLVREFMTQAKYRDESFLKFGSTLVVVKLNDGTEIKLALSVYGGFFWVVGDWGVYVLEGEAKKHLEQAQSDVIERNFAPKRIERNRIRGEKPPTSEMSPLTW